MLALAIGGSLALFAWRAPRLESGTAFAPLSRDSALLVNNVFLTAAAATVFIGTLYPLILDTLTGTKLSVGPPYFALTFAPIFVGLLIVMPFGPRLGWKRGDIVDASRVLLPAAGVALVLFVVVLALASTQTLAGALAFGLAGWVLGASAVDFWERRKQHSLGAAAVAVVLAHAGLGVTLIGISATSLWRSEALELLGPGERMQVGPYTLRLDDVEAVTGPNFEASRANISVLDGERVVAHLTPEQRLFPAEGQQTAETAIRTTGFSDLYVALGDARGAGRWTIRAYFNPFAPFIWFGGVIMALGGIVALFARLRRKAVTEPAQAVTVPA